MNGIRETIALPVVGIISAVLCVGWGIGTIFAAAWLSEAAGNRHWVFAALVGIIAVQMLIPAIYFGVRDMRAGK